MNNTAQLHEIAGYLPYNLPAKLSHIGVFNLDYEYPTGREYELGYISGFSTYGKGFNGTIKVSDKLSYDFEELDEIEIVLRPMSDLIKEITHKGETFVPLIRLMDLSWSTNWEKTSYLCVHTGINEAWIGFKENVKDVFGFNLKNGFFHLGQNNEYRLIKNQMLLFQKLSEWHFDYNDLLSQGKAISIYDASKGGSSE